MKTNYILIDCENVQHAVDAALSGEHFKVIVFVGANQPRIDFDVVTALQGLGSRAQYIKISGAGRNALDFHICYYLGRLALQEPEAYFHVIAEDKGYDPLIEHLLSKGIRASRSVTVREIAAFKPPSTASADDKLSTIISHLIKRGTQRPTTLKKLGNTAASLFDPRLPEDEVTQLLSDLRKQQVFALVGTKVTYNLPD